MADQIVTCSGCARKYKVREGSPAGEFECTNCGATVSYGESPPVAQAKPVTARGVAPGQGGPPARGGRGAPPGRQARGPGRSPGRGRGGGRGSYSRGRGGGGAGARRGARGGARGGYDEEDMGYGPPQKQNTGLYILLGVLAFLIVGGGIAIVALSGGDDEEPVRRNANQQDPAPVNPDPYVARVDPGPGPDEMSTGGGTQDPASAGTGTSRPGLQPKPDAGAGTGSGSAPKPTAGGSGGNPRRTSRPSRGSLRGAPPNEADIPEDLRGAKVMFLKRMTVKQFMAREVPHFDDTPADLKSDIDKLCAYLVDYKAASKQMRASGQLERLGRPAMPRILSSFGKITADWETDEGRSLVCSVDNTLWGILQRRYPDTYMVKLSPMSNPDRKTQEENVRRWFVWWYSTGYELESYVPEEEGEDEEDD